MNPLITQFYEQHYKILYCITGVMIMFILFNTFYLKLAQLCVPGTIATTWLFNMPYIIHVDKEIWNKLPPSEKAMLIKHEQVHINQRKREGWFMLVKYCYYHLTLGYDKNPYEVEAYTQK